MLSDSTRIIVRWPFAIANDSTPQISGIITDWNGYPIPRSALSTLILTIVDTGSGEIVNDCQDVNILNTGRGTINNQGILQVYLEPGDTDMSEIPLLTSVTRSFIIQWTSNEPPALTGRVQIDIMIERLVGT